ncbi:MAG TPA: 16S rRNA (adenine(1518)-N(6)/adenine(1519)-N(6))-dimethyltransferase RsmA [Candidatus Paceibacterota bacterium]
MIYKAKKALGQNFLKSQKALYDIVSAGEIADDDIILEIGPGKGALTEKLLEKAGQVIAIEKDAELIKFLKEKFTNEIKTGKLKLILGDILKISNFEFLISKQIPNSKFKGYKLIANIPYYITGAIFKKFLQEEKMQPERMVLLVQKEVAKRIIAQDKKESILSISVKAYGQPVYIETVKKRYFSPAPKVDSAILLIKNISKKLFTDNQISEEKFFELVKAGFAHKRKVLSSNLKPRLGSEAPKWLEECEIKEKARAEDLGLKDWLCLARLAEDRPRQG